VNPHIRVDNRITSSFTVPNNILRIGHMTTRIPSSVDDPRHAYYPTGNWLGDVPSSHRRRRNHHHLSSSLLHSMTKLIARDKAVSTFWNCTHKPSKGREFDMQYGCSKDRL
jgi:hypothetical protein